MKKLLSVLIGITAIIYMLSTANELLADPELQIMFNPQVSMESDSDDTSPANSDAITAMPSYYMFPWGSEDPSTKKNPVKNTNSLIVPDGGFPFYGEPLYQAAWRMIFFVYRLLMDI